MRSPEASHWAAWCCMLSSAKPTVTVPLTKRHPPRSLEAQRSGTTSIWVRVRVGVSRVRVRVGIRVRVRVRVGIRVRVGGQDSG